jgi:hypothetical protein
MARWAAFNQTIGAMINRSVQDSAAANAAAESARRSALFGR